MSQQVAPDNTESQHVTGTDRKPTIYSTEVMIHFSSLDYADTPLPLVTKLLRRSGQPFIIHFRHAVKLFARPKNKSSCKTDRFWWE